MEWSNGLLEAMKTVAERWDRLREPWLVGGSCGLTLHGVAVGAAPRDLDIYIDEAMAQPFHEALADYATDRPAYSETDKYRSTLSHYEISGVTVELVAGFVVAVPGARYAIDIAGAMARYALRTRAAGADVGVMPLGHELLFNLLRNRPDRYEPIAAAIRRRPDVHLPALRAIVRENELNADWRSRLSALAGVELGEADRFASQEDSACRK